jgi:hypothetical protein
MVVDAIIVGVVNPETLARVVEKMPSSLVRDVYVVARPSAVGVAAAATLAGAKLLSSQEAGVGAQLDRARVHLCALDRPPDVVVFVSSDGSDDPAELPLLFAPIRAGGADLVIGSRARGMRERGSPGCGLAQRMAALLIGAVYRQSYSDLSPFRAIRLPAWVALAQHERGFGYYIEMQIKAARAGLRVVEVPVHAYKAVRAPWRLRLSALLGTSWRFSYLLLRHATVR